MNVANLLSGFRLAIAPALLILAWTGQSTVFLVCFGAALFSDLIDGAVARRFGQASEFGAKLDSWGDLATYLILPFSAWWLWPDLIRQEAPWVITAIAAFVLPTLLGLLKFRRLTSYHTWGAKVSAVLMGPALFLLFAAESALAFRLVTLFFVLAEIEEIAITSLLPEWRADVASVLHARRHIRGDRTPL